LHKDTGSGQAVASDERRAIDARIEQLRAMRDSSRLGGGGERIGDLLDGAAAHTEVSGVAHPAASDKQPH
jgi:hypothetical protein